MNEVNMQSINTLQFGSLSDCQIKNLKKMGVVTFGHLHERATKKPDMLRAYEIDTLKLKQECEQYINEHGPKYYSFAEKPIIKPPYGFVLDADKNDIIMQRRADTKEERIALEQIAQALESELPAECMLTDLMQPVRNQGGLGACTGFGSVNSREFLLQSALSPGFAYRGAKFLDGYPDMEGSWQEFAFEFMYKHGCLLESEYTYEQCLDCHCIKSYMEKASAFKIKSYIDLMVSDSQKIPLILKAAISGQLVPELGPQPVAISVKVYESFCDWSAYSTGLIPVPFEGETLQGGHAMCVCGYKQIYGISYFVVINSWGEEFARDNPIGLPGYALLPEAYVAKYGMVGELIMPVD